MRAKMESNVEVTGQFCITTKGNLCPFLLKYHDSAQCIAYHVVRLTQAEDKTYMRCDMCKKFDSPGDVNTLICPGEILSKIHDRVPGEEGAVQETVFIRYSTPLSYTATAGGR